MSLPIHNNPSSSAAARQPVPAHQAVTVKPGAKAEGTKEGEGGFSFLDFIDIVNPLQHIPIISTIYRELTGDKINGPARVIGGAIFGGPVGAILGGVNAMVASENGGKDVGQLALNKVGIGNDDEDAVALARADATKNNIPVVEITPLHVDVRPISESPYASVKATDIVWDDTSPKHDAIQVASNDVMPMAKELNDLKPVAGFDPAFDDAASLNSIEPGVTSEKVAETNAPAAAPIENDQVANHMAQALAKYKAMQDVSDKAVIASTDPEAGVKTRQPFSGLQNIRRYSIN